MPRRPRIHLPGLPLHVVQRGHNRDACFFAEKDYLAYREWLGEACKATGCALHAYVQMTNHVHLLLSPPESEAVSRLMISLGRRYVQYINKTYRRTGTLWDSRYKSSLVQADAWWVNADNARHSPFARLSIICSPVIAGYLQRRAPQDGAHGIDNM